MDADALRIQRINARSRYRRLLTLLGLIDHRLYRSPAWAGPGYTGLMLKRKHAIRQQLTELGMQL